MRIHSIEAIAIDIPLSQNFGGATYSVLKRSTVVTRLRTEGGLVSEVYNGDNREQGPQIVALIRDELAPLVKGMSILESESVFAALFARTIPNRDRKVLLEAIACVDCAVWDVLGKAAGMSVHALLGGFRQDVPIISIGGYYREGKSLADIGREMEMYRAAGMAGCKFKVGGLAPEADAERVAAARKAAGPDFMLCVDANRGWAAQDAIRFARHRLVRGAVPLVRRCRADGARAGRDPHPRQRRPVRDHRARCPPPVGCQCRRFRQRRCLRMRRHHRVAQGRGDVRGGRRRDGAS